MIFLSVSAWSQQVDTTQIIRLLTLEKQIDSLTDQLMRMDSTIQRIKYERFESRDIASLLAEIGGEEENIPEDQRSKRKRLDALLKAITDKLVQMASASALTRTFPRVSPFSLAGTQIANNSGLPSAWITHGAPGEGGSPISKIGGSQLLQHSERFSPMELR